jgi:hypothetical protein
MPNLFVRDVRDATARGVTDLSGLFGPAAAIVATELSGTKSGLQTVTGKWCEIQAPYFVKHDRALFLAGITTLPF